MAKRKAAKPASRGRKTAKKTAARTTNRRAAPRKASRKAARKTGAGGARKAGRTGKARGAVKAARKTTDSRAKTAVARKAPALNRARRTIQGDDIVPTPPSSLDLDRTASAARSGRRQMSERLHEHNETSPALTAGDVDADWESAATVGDEAPGGDNPTPDQDIVEDIGKAVGVVYEDNEELKGEEKIIKRDKHRWELDPASSEDFKDRS
ncbi:MAG TPA: DUF6335 family protein [Vicinamibacterales bacterium]